MYVFFGEIFILGLLPILIRLYVLMLLSFINCLFLETNPLLVASFANFFFQSVGCLFIFFSFFAIQQLLSLSRSHLFIFLILLLLFFVDRSENILLQFISKSVLLMFHSGAFLVAQTHRESVCNVKDLGSIPGSGISLEKGTATHSSILAWRMPWTEEPDGLQSFWWQTVRQD